MDKFGYIRGRRGPPGPPGKNAVELHTWCPKGVLEMFRKDEQCTFYFNTAEDGILKEKGKMSLKDRFGIKHAVCLQNFQKPMKVGEYYAIPLKKSLYKISDIQTATTPPSICIIAFQFKVSSKLSNENVYIFTNGTATRGVTISKKSLNILGTDPLELDYLHKEWNTLVVQYSNMERGGKCFFVLNGQRGFFVPHKTAVVCEEVYIGGDSKGENSADVVLTNFEIYYKQYDPAPDSYILPQQILKLINDDMGDRAGDDQVDSHDFGGII